MIQGVGVHGAGWQPQVDGLSAHYSCLYFDNRGMAASQPVGQKVSIEQMAEDALALMDQQDWDSAHIAGHSMGGVIALHLASIARERTRSLALLCSFARWQDAVRASPAVLWTGLRTRLGTRRMRRNAFLEFVMPPALRGDSDLDRLAADLIPIFGHDLADAPPITMQQAAALRNYDGNPRLPGLAGLPTLVVNAAFDPIAPPKTGRAMAEKIPGASYVELPEAAHGATVQCADQLNALLQEHFERADAAR